MRLTIPHLGKAFFIAVCTYSAAIFSLQRMALVNFDSHLDLGDASMIDPFMIAKQGIQNNTGTEDTGGSDVDDYNVADHYGDGERNNEWWLGTVDDDSLEDSNSSHNLRTPYDPRYDNITAWPFRDPKDVHIYFVHVGKAGGKSLYKNLDIPWAPHRARCRMKSEHINNRFCYGKNINRFHSMPIIAKRILGHIHETMVT